MCGPDEARSRHDRHRQPCVNQVFWECFAHWAERSIKQPAGGEAAAANTACSSVDDGVVTDLQSQLQAAQQRIAALEETLKTAQQGASGAAPIEEETSAVSPLDTAASAAQTPQ